MILEYSSDKIYDLPLPITEDYSPVSAAEDLILHYLQWLWFSTTNEIHLEYQTIYTSYLPSRRYFCLLLVAATAKCWESRVKSQAPQEPRALLRHYSLERKRSLVRRERVSQEGEAEFTRVQKKTFFDTLFSEERIVVYSVESHVFLSSCLEEDCSIDLSQMTFEHLSIFCSV